jgi:hypothetical protein
MLTGVPCKSIRTTGTPRNSNSWTFLAPNATAVNTMVEYKYWQVRELEGNDDCGG